MAAAAPAAGGGSPIFQMLFANFLLEIGKENATPRPISCVANASVCYDIYGLEEEFPLSPPWSNTDLRPMPMVPFSPQQLDTRFWLYSSRNHSQPIVLDLYNKSVLFQAPLHLHGKVYIVTHGYRSSGSYTWAKLLTGELLRAEASSNVVVVDWSKGANVDYSQCVANIRVVARQVAFFVNSLQTILGFPGSSFHLIGHSLGAHLCGIAGTYLQDLYGTKIHRITGLDPAHPLHDLGDTITRLDAGDAEFVDVVHSDNYAILGFPITVGMMDAIGHLDFYPNGGGPQPGCDSSDLKCSHARAIYLFIDSIRQECSFLGVRCPTYKMFLKGECWGCEPPHDCAEMGLRTSLTPYPEGSKFFFLTRDLPPYCGQHYLVTLTVSNSSAAADHDGEFGILYLTLEGSSGKSYPISLTETTEYYQVGSVHKYVVLAKDVGEVRRVRITFRYPGPSFNPMSWRLQEPRLHLSKLQIQKLGAADTAEFCFESTEQRSGLEYILTLNDICEF